MPVDPTPEALARDPEVRDALNEFVEDWGTAGEAFARNHLISTIISRYRATRATSGKVLDFDRALNAVTDDKNWNIEYEDDLEAQAQERVGALEVRIAEMSVAIADVKAKEECRPLAISSTSLRTAVQNLYRFVEAPR